MAQEPSDSVDDDAPFRPEWWSEDRREIYKWLSRNAAELAELYAGATYLVFGSPSFPGRVRFIAHAVREIRNRLPDEIAGPRAAGRIEYPQRLREIADAGGMSVVDGPNSETEALDVEDTVPLPRVAYPLLTTLVTDAMAPQQANREAATRLFAAVSFSAERTSLRPFVKQWVDITEWFMSRVHVPTQDKAMNQSHDGLTDKFVLFESTLRAMAKGFYSTTRELDEILEETNS